MAVNDFQLDERRKQRENGGAFWIQKGLWLRENGGILDGMASGAGLLS